MSKIDEIVDNIKKILNSEDPSQGYLGLDKMCSLTSVTEKILMYVLPLILEAHNERYKSGPYTENETFFYTFVAHLWDAELELGYQAYKLIGKEMPRWPRIKND